MRHPVTQELFAYWAALRAGRSAPERSAIDPTAIRSLLAHTFLLDVGQPDGAGSHAVSFRLSGTRLNALFRRELKGEAFAGLWARHDRGEAAALLEGVLDDCVPAVAGVRGGPKDYAPAEFELLLLPLRHHGRTHARLLGSIAAETIPSWIGLRPIEGFSLSSFRTILPRDIGWPERLGVVMPHVDPPHILARSAGPMPAPPIPVGARPGPFRVYEGGRTA